MASEMRCSLVRLGWEPSRAKPGSPTLVYPNARCLRPETAATDCMLLSPTYAQTDKAGVRNGVKSTKNIFTFYKLIQKMFQNSYFH